MPTLSDEGEDRKESEEEEEEEEEEAVEEESEEEDQQKEVEDNDEEEQQKSNVKENDDSEDKAENKVEHEQEIDLFALAENEKSMKHGVEEDKEDDDDINNYEADDDEKRNRKINRNREDVENEEEIVTEETNNMAKKNYKTERNKKDKEEEEEEEVSQSIKRRKTMDKEKNSFVHNEKYQVRYDQSYAQMTGNVGKLVAFDITKLSKKKYKKFKKLLKDCPELSNDENNIVDYNAESKPVQLQIQHSSFLGGKTKKFVNYQGRLMIHLPQQIIGDTLDPAPCVVLHCSPNTENEKEKNNLDDIHIIMDEDSITNELGTIKKEDFCFEIKRDDEAVSIVDKKHKRPLLMDDRLTSDNNDKEDDGEKKKKKKKHRKKKKIYVDEMVLSADTADDLEDWLSDIKETTRICRKIIKYVDAIYEKEVESREEEDNIKWLENQTELQYKNNNNSSDDDDAPEVESSDIQSEQHKKYDMKKDHGGNEFEDDEDDNDVSDSIAKSREKARKKRMENMQIITGKGTMTDEEEEAFWEARSLDPYKEHRKKMENIKEEFYEAEIASTKLIDEIEKAESPEQEFTVHHITVPAKTYNLQNEILVTAERAHGTAVSSEALKFISKTVHDEYVKNKKNKTKYKMGKSNASTNSTNGTFLENSSNGTNISFTGGSQLYSTASTATSSDFRPNILRSESEWDTKIEFFQARVKGLCEEADLFVIDSKLLGDLDMYGGFRLEDKFEVERKLKTAGRPLKINFKLIKKELYAECDYWFEELGRPTHPVRLARHGQLLLDRNSLYDDLLDLNDRLRDAENKALPYIEKLESFLASYEKQVKDNKRNYGSNNHNNDNIKESTEVVVTRIIEGENILQKRRVQELKKVLFKFGKVWPPDERKFPNHKLPAEGVALYHAFIHSGPDSTRYNNTFEVAKALDEIISNGRIAGTNSLIANNKTKSFDKVLAATLLKHGINPKAFETSVEYNNYVTGHTKNINHTIKCIKKLLTRKENARTKQLRKLFNQFHPKNHEGITAKCIFNHLFKNNRSEHEKKLSIIDSNTMEGSFHNYLPQVVIPLYKPATYKKCFEEIVKFQGTGKDGKTYSSHMNIGKDENDNKYDDNNDNGMSFRNKKVGFKQFKNWALSKWQPCLRV